MKRQRDHRRVRDLYLRGLGVVALLAFHSLARQLPGLIGEDGISPAAERMARARRRFERVRLDLLPTLFWWSASNQALLRAARAGEALGALLALGVAPLPCALGIGAIQLSFIQVGDLFLGYQWDSLLAESALHAALVAPCALTLGRDDRRVSGASAALVRALLFRLHFESGAVKWKSADRAWRGLEAMGSYYETAPLPTRPGWYAHHLPSRVQKLSTAAAMGIECLAPLLGFAGRRGRATAFGLLSALQALIATTGNYGFFNLLTLATNLWYLDDAQLPGRRARPPRRGPSALRRATTIAAGAAITAVALPPLLSVLEVRAPRPRWLAWLQEKLRPLELGNPYGPFSVMTRTRPELRVEGTRDGVTWKPYRYRYKVDDARRPPRFVAPHQPRLDWQMWFAALDPVPAWFLRFLKKLLEGSPAVLALLAENPFPDGPPKQVRAQLDVYRMASLEEHRETGAWWTRVERGVVLPPVRLSVFDA